MLERRSRKTDRGAVLLVLIAVVVLATAAYAWIALRVDRITESLRRRRPLNVLCGRSGGVSLVARNADAASYRHMLTMKLLWSGAAVLGLLISLFEGAPVMTAGFLAVFASFFGVWLYYRLRLKIV